MPACFLKPQDNVQHRGNREISVGRSSTPGSIEIKPLAELRFGVFTLPKSQNIDSIGIDRRIIIDRIAKSTNRVAKITAIRSRKLPGDQQQGVQMPLIYQRIPVKTV